MPCDQIRRSKVSFKIDVTDLDLFRKSMKKMGFNHVSKGQSRELYSDMYGNSAELKSGGLEVTSTQKFDMDKLKREYSTEVVKDTCERYGWSLNETSENEYEIVKSY